MFYEDGNAFITFSRPGGCIQCISVRNAERQQDFTIKSTGYL